LLTEKNKKTKRIKMTKADIVTKISDRLGLDKPETQAVVEQFMQEVKNALESGEAVYLRGFGSFIVKTRAEKKGRNISKNVTIDIPAHNIPAFKPAKVFVEGVKSKVDVK
jgi:DNA-binding protein HU-beta